MKMIITPINKNISDVILIYIITATIFSHITTIHHAERCWKFVAVTNISVSFQLILRDMQRMSVFNPLRSSGNYMNHLL
jgi:hypothetical protein